HRIAVRPPCWNRSRTVFAVERTRRVLLSHGMARRGPRARRQSVRNAVAHRVVRSLLGSRAGYRRRSVWQRPMTEPTLDVTKLLAAWTAGDPEALDRLLPVVYDELRRLARNRKRLGRPGQR